MKVKVCSAFSDKELEQKIQRAVDENQDSGYTLKHVCYSTAVDPTARSIPNKDRFFRSAIMTFEMVR